MLPYWLFKLRDWMSPHNETCTNCGGSVTGAIRCRMWDRCIKSQNDQRWAIYSQDDIQAIMRGGGRIFTDDCRVLCMKCAEENMYICWSCELEVLEESKQ